MGDSAGPTMISEARRRLCVRVAGVLGVCVALCGAAVLTGWTAGLDAVKSIRPGWSTMKANTAFGFILLGAAIALVARANGGPVRPARALAGVSLLFALLTLFQHFGLAMPGFDTLFADAPPAAYPPGRAAPATALMLASLSVGVLTLGTPAWRLRLSALALTLGLSLIALSGYLYDAELLYRTPGFSTTAIHTAFCGAFAGAACVLLAPDHPPLRLFLTDTASGAAMRRFVLPGLAALVVVQVVLAVAARAEMLQVPLAQGLELLVVGALVLVLFVSVGRHMDRFERDLLASHARLSESEAKFRLMADSAPVKIWLTNEVGEVVFFNRRWAQFTGMPPERTLGYRWSEVVHPDELEAVVERYRRHVQDRTPFQFEVRLRRHDGEYRSLLATGAPFTDANGDYRGFVGSSIDITEVRLAMDRQALLMRELDHRVKNNLASVIAVAESTFAATHDAESFMEAFRGRVMAMARSHTALAAVRWTGLRLDRLVRTVVAPLFHDPDSSLMVEGPDVVVPSIAVAPMAMVLHELGTNALKHGACAGPGGRVEVHWTADDGESSRLIRLEWTERPGVGSIESRPGRASDSGVGSSGLGLSIVQGLVETELGGSVSLHMPPGDFSCVIEFSESSWRTLVRSAEMSRVDQQVPPVHPVHPSPQESAAT